MKKILRNKTTEKISKIVLILLVITLTVLGLIKITDAVGSYDNKDRNVIIGAWYSNKWNQIKYTFKDSNSTNVTANYGDGNGDVTKDYVLVTQINTNNTCPIVNQPNVWCVQNGADLAGAPSKYSIGKEIEVTDPMLAYILAHGPEMEKMEKNFKNDAAQNALWKYLSDKSISSEDKKNILSNISCNPPETERGKEIYEDAKKYSKNLANIENIGIDDFKIEYDKNKLTVTSLGISGIDSFKVTAQSENKKITGETTSDQVSLDISSLTGKISVNINLSYNIYTVKYRILKSATKDQRLMVVTHVSNEPIIKTDLNTEIEKLDDSSVSLEKYITKVITINKESSTTYNNREWKRYNQEGDISNKNPYKKENPIEVEQGEKIEYTIKITNTGEGAIEINEIQDTPNQILRYDSIESGWNYNNGIINPSATCKLNPAESIYFKIYFIVDKETNQEIIENKARITKINGNDIGDNDKDGLNNNADADFIKLVKYSVSLQKYITKVEDTTIYSIPEVMREEIENETVIYTYDVNKDGFVDLKDINFIQNYINQRDSFDLDNDGEIKVQDATFLEKWLEKNSGKYESKYDVNNDGVVNELDVEYIQRIINNSIYVEIDDQENLHLDIDKNGKIDSNDIKVLNEWISSNTRENLRKDEKKNNPPVGVGPVEVELGDTITYTIKISNTGDATIKVDKIYDNPEVNTYKNIFISSQEMEYVARTMSCEEIEINTRVSQNGIEIKFTDPLILAAGEYIYIDVRTKISANGGYDGSSVTLGNKAEILEIKNSDGRKVTDSDGPENNYDYDYVKVKKYAVSLEKFITKVTDKDGNILKQYNAPSGPYQDRYGKRYNDNDLATEEIVTSGDPDKITRHPYKVNEENYVQVEVGDKVTFNVRLKNTGEAQVKITEIEDVFTNENGIKLKFESGQYNGEKIIFSDNNKIVFSDDKAKLLEVNEIIDIQMTFSVEVSEDKSNVSQILENKAKIITIKNKDNIPVTDADGTSNNADKDILKTKTYAVSLEKYVSEVTDIYGNNKVTYTNSRVNKAEYNIDKNDANSKYKNIVNVETGDKVTYIIKATNNGDTEVYIPSITDYLPNGVKYNNSTYNGGQYNQKTDNEISIANLNRELLEKGKSVTFTITVEVTETNPELQILQNTANITNNEIKNRNGVTVIDTTLDDNEDADYIKIKPYKVSLEKYVSKVTKPNGTITTYEDRDGSDNTTADKSEHKYDNDKNTNNQWKYNNPVTVEKGDKVTYTIKIKNDGETDVKLTNIADYLPDGVLYKNKVYTGNQYAKSFDVTFNTDNIINNIEAILLKGNSMFTFTVEVEVIEPNISVNILKNVAEIVSMVNRNNVNISDSTPNNNRDADYIQMKDIIISGTVWEDLATDKTQNNYDGLYNNGESKLAGIKVYLYRSNKEKVATTTTDDNGNYLFALNYIKGAKVEGTNRWAGTYYAYYLVFEYDGIKYTSTNYKDITSNNKLDSNAQESLTERTEFNNKFSTINNSKGIEYITKNEEGNIPQSNYVYNPNTMSMHSSTSVIILSKNWNLEAQLKHINLGLKGRNIFDLELTSDVYKVDVKVNNQDVEYLYNNKVTLRKSDVYVDRQNQYIRNSDKSALNSIYVTYKITVKNASQTAGTATEITNYYDNKYTFIKAYSGNNEMTIQNGKVNEAASGNGFESVSIRTPEIILNQSDKMEIYVVYQLNDVSKVLENVTELATYNMAEIAEYKTYAISEENEYTRGLIDKDSAPESANTEQVRLTTGDLVGRSTVGYYFNAKNLNLLKYEDDTYATPTLYFVVTDENVRTITGTVFEDKTTTNPTTRIKTGNGKLDEGEIGVFGAKVELIKQVGDEKVIIDTKYTDENGKFEFINFLPGNYIIRYYYGDTKNTIMKGQQVKEIDGDGNIIKQINAKSYNGEDFQSTNNSYIIEKMETNKLSERDNFWYLDNEEARISTARDDTERRSEVTANVINTEDDNSNKLMMKLNAARAGILTDDELNEQLPKGKLIDQTYMFADTEKMLFTVEKSEVKGDKVVQGSSFGEYIISNMNFGIAEVPVTTVDLQKTVQEFTLTDSTGNNIIASVVKNDSGKWELKGDVIAPEGATSIDVSVEDEKLQGARLQVTYAITSKINTEKNYDGKEEVYATITELIDYIDNNLSYNSALGENSKYWEITTYSDIFTDARKGTVDSEGKKYTTIVKAKADNPILKNIENGTATITLEKVLSSTDSTLEEIITSTVDTYEYNNTVEITGISYENAKQNTGSEPRKDLVRTADKYIILAGRQHDSATAETITIHPPTGDSSINTMYYILAVVSLVILAGGVFGIKKFVLTNRKS